MNRETAGRQPERTYVDPSTLPQSFYRRNPDYQGEPVFETSDVAPAPDAERQPEGLRAALEAMWRWWAGEDDPAYEWDPRQSDGCHPMPCDCGMVAVFEQARAALRAPVAEGDALDVERLTRAMDQAADALGVSSLCAGDAAIVAREYALARRQGSEEQGA